MKKDRLIELKEELPSEVKNHLIKNEKVHYFSFLSSKGGCSQTGNRDNYWIALTNKRVIYKTKVLEGNQQVQKEGLLPLDKVSFVEVTELTQSQGCSTLKGFEIRVSTSGGTVNIPVPTKEKGNEIRNIFLKISENK